MKTRKYSLEGQEVSKAQFLKGIKAGKSGTDEYVPQHIPTPWKLKSNINMMCEERALTVYAKGKREIAEVMVLGQRSKVAKANAAFIVRAVNSHEELVGTLRVIAQYKDVPQYVRDAANEAIAKAEGL